MVAQTIAGSLDKALVAAGQPEQVFERLGHNPVKITLDVYAHVLPDMQEQAAAVMDSVIRWE